MNTDNIQIILHQPSHPGNIGAVARSMWTMDLSQLTLVEPRRFPDPEATQRASGAECVLAKAHAVDDLDAALADSQLIFTTSAQLRHLAWPQLTPKEAARMICDVASQQRVAILFGPERTGLVNDDLQRGHHQIAIPANPAYSSLNLAMAVQVIAYEIYSERLAREAASAMVATKARDLATDAQMQGFFEHLQALLDGVHFRKPTSSPNLMPKLQRLFKRAALDQDDINLLRGLFKAVLQNTPAKQNKQGYWVYILHCENDSYYTGYTHDLAKRYQSHVEGTGQCKYTRSFKPLKMAQAWKINADKAFAMQIERKIKKLSRAEKIRIIDHPDLLSEDARVVCVESLDSLVSSVQARG